MSRRGAQASIHQLAFSFEAPRGPATEGGLAGLDRAICQAVSAVLKDDARSRWEIAGGMSALLDDEVSKAMLDAYSAEAREGHNISLARFLALIAQTERYDVLDGLLRKIGCGIVVGEEALTVELGHIDTEMERLRARREVLKRAAPGIGHGRRPTPAGSGRS